MIATRTCRISSWLHAGILTLTSLAVPSRAQWTAVGPATGVSPAGSSYQALTRDSAGNFYVAFQDSSVSKGSLMKWNGTSWSYLGSAGISTGHTSYSSVATGRSNQAFYAMQDIGAGTRLSIIEYNGTTQTNNWQNVSSGMAYFTSIQVGSSGNPYVLYRDIAISGMSARKFDGTAWKRFGNSGFGTLPSTIAYFPKMVIGQNDTAYAASVHAIFGVQVYKLHTAADSLGTWQPVGTTGWSTASGSIFQDYLGRAIDSSNRLYLAYTTSTSTGNKLTVARYANGTWSNLGSAAFTAGSATNVSLAVTPSGTPYVSFADGANSGRITVMTYDGNSWGVVGTAGFSTGAARYTSLVLDASGNPVVAYNDAGNGYKTMVMKFTPPPCTNSDPAAAIGSTGCVTFNYRGTSVTYKTVRAADSNIWLQQNFGSMNVADSANDATAYGDVFQWGRWDDGHQSRTAATATPPTANNPSGLGSGSAIFYVSSPAWWASNSLTDTWTGATPAAASSTGGCDPCKAMGAGWRLPTQGEWAGVVAGEGITLPAHTGAYASRLKLTAGGNRNSGGTYDFVGLRGYYWSSTTSSTGGKYYYFSAAANNPNAGGLRGQGMSVRCMKDFTVHIDSLRVAILNSAAPTISTNGGTLGVVATVYPAAANQNVRWFIVPVSGTATISTAGTVTAISNGTVWAKAVAVADTFRKDSVLITISGQLAPAVSIAVATQGGIAPTITTNAGVLQVVSTVSPATASQSVTWSVVAVTGTASINVTGLVSASRNGTVWAKAVSDANPALADSLLITISGQIIPADSIAVSVQSGAAPIINTQRGTLQMQSLVFPAGASQAVNWSVVSGTGTATISPAGLVTAQTNGSVWAKAVSQQNTTLADSLEITITNQTPAGIGSVGAENGIAAYPNPVHGALYLHSAKSHATLSLRVTDIQGRTMFERTVPANGLKQPQLIHTTSWPKGNYFLLIDGASIAERKLITVQ